MRRRLLIIDDDELVRRSLRRLLGSEYAVTEAASAQEALEHLDSGAHFDAILCDVVMPDMSGIALVSFLGDWAPHVASRVVMMTGGILTSEERAAFDALPLPKVAKPFDVALLKEALRRAEAPSTQG